MLYEALLHDLVEEARQEEDVIGVLLTGSLARGDALPGTDIDLRFLLAEGLSRPFRSEDVDGILVERSHDDFATAQATLAANPMHVYAYLDGRILYDPQGSLAQLNRQARQRFESYRTPEQQRSTIDFLLKCAQDKIIVAVNGGDLLKAAFVTSTCSWQVIEGLWAANHLPLPPNSSVRPHLPDLPGPPDVEAMYEQLFLGETQQRVQVALDLIEWIRPSLSDGLAKPAPKWSRKNSGRRPGGQAGHRG